MNMRFNKILVLLIMGVVFSFSCSSNKIKGNLPVDERMNLAMKMFDKHDYLDAKSQFRIITLSYSGNAVADKAQYYLAECHFFQKEYILSASEYERLIKVYPNSEWVDDAKYKLGLSYYELSPKPSLDQEYTFKAIKEFQEFLEDYHFSPLVETVEKQLKEAQDKLAKKMYVAADQYRKMSYYNAATIYYSKVLENYYDSQYAPLSQYWMGECYSKMKNYEEAQDAFKIFARKYPNHELLPKVRDRLVAMNEQLINLKADSKE